LIPALKWMVSIIKTYCLREIFCPILSSTRITSHFSRTEPRRIGLTKLSNTWKSRRQTSFHQICGHPTALISTQWTTRSGAYCKNGFTRQAVRMSTSYDAGLLRNGTSLTSAIDKAVGEWRKRLQVCVAAGGGHFEHKMWHLSFTIFCIGILRPSSEILLFCSVNTGCFVECNACYVLHFVTA